LFADRARRADPRFTLDGGSGPAVARLVRRLDGMPLAIELAAARVEALGVAGLADRLDDRFALLAGGDRLAPLRQRSLAAAVAWSYELLAEPERAVFRKLASIPCPFTLEAAMAMAGADAGQAVLHLVDCSMLIPPRTWPDGRARYAVLETVRAYGTERLAEAGEDEQAAAALAGFALRVAQQAATGFETSGGELASAAWLDAEDATVHQGLAWAQEHDPATCVRLAVALAPWWVLRNRDDLGYRLLAAAAERVPADGDAWAAAQFWLGRLARDSGDVALRHFTQARDAMAGNGPRPLLVRAMNGRAVVQLNMGLQAEAEEEARRALALARQLGYAAGEAAALRNLQIATYYSGDLQSALAWVRQAQRIDPATIPGSVVRTRDLFAAGILVDAGEHAEALRYCEDALASARQAGDQRDESECLQLLAELNLQTGRVPQAQAYLRQAIDGVSRGADLFGLINCLSTCGFLCARTGRHAEAITAWAALDALLQARGITQVQHELNHREEPLGHARGALGPTGAAVAEERGAAMGPAAATEYVAMLVAPEPAPRAAEALHPLRLSARERELVTLVARGQTNAQIASQLFISVRTVGSHLDRIRDKSGCRRRADLTRLALEAGLV
jgi:predicted ATPase/DNA-binding CsgD family transcriptional regulator